MFLSSGTLVRCLKTRKKNQEPSCGGGKNIRCRTLPRRTLKDLLVQRNQFEESCLLFLRARDPSGSALVPCTLSAVDKCRQKHVDLQKHTHKHTHVHTNRESNSRHPTLVCDPTRRVFFSSQNEEKEAQRCALRAAHYYTIHTWYNARRKTSYR